MEKVYTSSDHSFQLLSQMSDLWRGNKFCDAVLNLQDERFQLHKVVLMAACPNILRCLAHTEENNIFEFYLPEDIEKSAVRLTVNYLYVGSVQLNMENVYGIEKLAKQLRLSTLSQFCHDFISLLELETFHQSLLQPVIDQENIPKQESTQVENIVESKAVDELNSTTNATLSKINDRAYSISLPQSTDGFEQPPLASKRIKTELDASIGLTQEETISATQGKTITIEPLSNILQISKGDNSMTTTLTASLCKSYGSTTLDQQSVSDRSRLESHSVSHQTDSMGILNPLLNSSQISTISSLTPLPSKVACTPSTSQSHSDEGDYIGLIMTAEDEDFEDSDNEWVPQGDESSDSDYCPASSLDRFTKTKRKMPTKGPKAKRSKIDAPFTATEKTEGCDKMTSAGIKKITDSRKVSNSSGTPKHLNRFHRADKPDRLFVSDMSYITSDCADTESEQVNDQADILNNIETQHGDHTRRDRSCKTAPQNVRKSKRRHCSEHTSSTGVSTRKKTSNNVKLKINTRDRANEKSTQDNKGGSCDRDSAITDDEKRKQMERKLKIVEHAEIHGVKSAAESYNITEDIVEDWIMLKSHFTRNTRVEKNLALSSKYKKFIKMGEYTDLEDRVINWLVETQYNPGLADDVTIIQNKSEEIAEEIGKPGINIGNNWVKQMLEKYIRKTKNDKTNETLNIFNFELRQQVRDYAEKNGVKTAAEHFNLPQETVACWKKNRNQNIAPATKLTRNRYKFNFKLDAVKCAEQVGNMGAARVYGVSEKNIRDWRKQKEQLIQYEENRLGMKRSITRPYSLIESLLKNWILSERRNITVEEIRAKALLFAEQTNSPEFKASYSWCIRFIKLHNMQEHMKPERSKNTKV